MLILTIIVYCCLSSFLGNSIDCTNCPVNGLVTVKVIYQTCMSEIPIMDAGFPWRKFAQELHQENPMIRLQASADFIELYKDIEDLLQQLV